MNLHRERRSGVIDRLNVVDQVRHRRLTGRETVPDNIRDRLVEIFDSWNTPTPSTDRDHTVIPRIVRAEASALARELQASGFYITDQQLLIDSVLEGWRVVREKYSDSPIQRREKQE